MKVDKSLQEVWEWKDNVYRETEKLSVREASMKISEDAEVISKKYKLNLRKFHLSQR